MNQELLSTGEQFWCPEIPEYEPKISLIESQGGIARALWQEKFRSIEQVVSASSELIYTDIGGGVAYQGIEWAANMRGMKKHGDGSLIPPYIPLKEKFGYDPRSLFLVASPRTSDEVVSLCSVAEEYKSQGVDYVFVLFTALAHERQDHHFYDSNGKLIYQAETLQTVIRLIARSGLIDGGLILQPHSMQPTRIGLMEGFLLLPLDATKMVVDRSGVRNVLNPFIIGADKGRKNVAKMIASMMECPYGVCIKTRARTTDGLPEVEIPDDVLQYIFRNNCSVIVPDDEIREGGTVAALRKKFAGWAKRFYVIAEKGYFAELNGTKITAAQMLSLPIEPPYDEERIVVTDAVAPLFPVDEIKDKLGVIPINEDINNLMCYLKHNFVPNGNPKWLRDRRHMGTQIRLDLMKEEYV